MPRIFNRCAPFIRKFVAIPSATRSKLGQLKITGFFDQVRVRVIDGDLLARYDPHDIMFFNANTPEEYAKAQHMFEEQH